MDRASLMMGKILSGLWLSFRVLGFSYISARFKSEKN